MQTVNSQEIHIIMINSKDKCNNWLRNLSWERTWADVFCHHHTFIHHCCLSLLLFRLRAHNGLGLLISKLLLTCDYLSPTFQAHFFRPESNSSATKVLLYQSCKFLISKWEVGIKITWGKNTIKQMSRFSGMAKVVFNSNGCNSWKSFRGYSQI